MTIVATNNGVIKIERINGYKIYFVYFVTIWTLTEIFFYYSKGLKFVLYLFKLMTNLKHITVDPKVYEKLRDLGKTSDSFNDVLKKILFEQQQSPESVRGLSE